MALAVYLDTAVLAVIAAYLATADFPVSVDTVDFPVSVATVVSPVIAASPV